ncbi:mucin-4-like [Aphis craccivora]|uniref:Mucin-4-like n=1 Tax=Aphis craccivora TaxID=307492 RepID=A0A6G0Z0P2_APHCR|nr:mucin-4-like [Aphis craccivora]
MPVDCLVGIVIFSSLSVPYCIPTIGSIIGKPRRAFYDEAEGEEIDDGNISVYSFLPIILIAIFVLVYPILYCSCKSRKQNGTFYLQTSNCQCTAKYIRCLKHRLQNNWYETRTRNHITIFFYDLLHSLQVYDFPLRVFHQF